MTSLFGTAVRLWDRFMAETALTCEDLAGRFVRPKAVVVRQVSAKSFEVVHVSASRRMLGLIEVGSRENAPLSGDLQAALNGAQIELVLLAEGFLFKEMTLPAQAGSFLQQIISNQIDRLTPWTSDCAIFGFAERGIVDSKLLVTVAVTDKRRVAPILDILSVCKPQVVHMIVAPAEDGAPPILVSAPLCMGDPRPFALRRALATAFIALWGLVAVDQVYATWMAGRYQDEIQATNAEIAQRRASLLSPGVLTDEGRALLARKKSGPVATLLLEDLSALLPDDTYLTEFELDGSKLRIAGTSLDATRLIGFLEGSGRVSNVTFYAPTTRSRSNPGERFFIEAVVRDRLGGKS
ncbi:MAG: Fimbrial assembly [Hyphomicrobiales bacterium]|nr:Fimbrial assembly [Hyphomicrobiales bacterium]